MALSKLIFFPADFKQFTSQQTLLATLLKCKLIHPPQTNPGPTHKHYLAGEHFLSLITFLGCSPNINLLPVDGENHCYISLIKASTRAKRLGFTNTAKPKCPACKKRISHWKTLDGQAQAWQQADNICTCDKCQTATAFGDLNWKQECGYGRCGFEIAHIYPHEAVPTDQLLNILHQFTGFLWNYCYANS